MNAISRSWEWTLRILLPFDFSRWITFAVIVWVSMLASGGLSIFGNWGENNKMRNEEDTLQSIREGSSWILANWALVTGIGVILFLLITAIYALLLWLSCRAAFSLVHSAKTGTPQMTAPWKHYAREGNSLFLGRFIIGMGFFILQVILTVPAVVAMLGPLDKVVAIDDLFSGAVLLPVLGILVGSLLLFSLYFKIDFLVYDFITPIMYHRRATFTEACGIFGPLFAARLGEILIYGLIRLSLAFLIGIVSTAVIICFICGTCCIGALPVLSAIPMVPFEMFRRSIALFYLEQWGPEYFAFDYAPEAPPQPLPMPPAYP